MGHFIFKFLKELNSATSSKMLVLAIVLGLISGFLPVVNIVTLLIFLVIFIFRVPIGLFSASFSFFKFIGYLLDPTFHNIGLFLLKSSSLNSFWTYLYNLPFFRWSGFNNTIVVGSLFTGIILGTVLYFILLKLTDIYRATIFEKLKTKKYLSWLIPNEKKGIIRIAGVGFIVVSSIILTLFFMFLLDPLIKKSLETGLSKSLHKKVAIESVNTNLKNLSITIKNMQIESLLLHKIYTKLNWNKIVWKKYQIDDLEIIAKTNQNILNIINSTQTTKKESSVSMPKFNINMNIPKAENFLAKQELKSTAAIKKLQKDYKKVQTDIKNLRAGKEKKEFDDLKNKIDSMKNIKIKTPDDLKNLIADINKIKKDSDNLLKEIKKDKNILKEDKKLLSNDIKNVKVALEEDKKNIRSKYKMLQNKEYMQFAETIFKPKISKYIKTADDLYQKIKPYIHKTKNEKEEKEYIRHKGIDVKFKDKTLYPDFVLVKSLGEIQTSLAKWDIQANNIADNQLLLNKTAAIKIKGNSKFFDVGANIFYLKEIKFNGYGKKIQLKNVDIDFANINALLNTKINGTLVNNITNTKIVSNLENVKFIKIKENIKKILGDSLSSVKKFTIIADINGNLNSPKIKISSDLDNILSKMLKSQIHKLINKEEKRTEKILNDKIKESLKKINPKILDLNLKKLHNLENIKELINKKSENIIKNKKNSLKKKAINKIKNKGKDLIKKKIKNLLHF